MGFQANKIAVLGLGYVGLPLAVEFAKQTSVIGFDIDHERVNQIRLGVDRTLEVSSRDLLGSKLVVTADEEDLASADFYIVTTPTPVDKYNQPDLEPVLKATETVAKYLSVGDVVVFESTVYPGATEEKCVPILERVSGLRYNEEFYVGYSPERINPGDKLHRLPDIKKITSGSTREAAAFVDSVYSSIITAGTHLAPSISVAEAAKVIENTQRDVNIALINDLAILFEKLNIDTNDVLKAASTKWNFLPFKPGLVGGHCIGVDPYYLTYKAQSVGHNPELILAGRRINDSMGVFVATQLVKEMARKRIDLSEARVLLLGLTFKEDTPDLRNSKVLDVFRELTEYGLHVDVCDPLADPEYVKNILGLELVDLSSVSEKGIYDAVMLAVAHAPFRELNGDNLQGICKPQSVVFDLKDVLPRDSRVMRL